MHFANIVLLAAAGALALPAQEDYNPAVEKRFFSPIIVSGIVGLFEALQGKFDWKACTEAFKDNKKPSTTYWSEQKYGGSDATLCFTNGTKTIAGETEAAVFAQRDADVAKCLARLHAESGFICISTAGSVCDVDNYLGTGGFVVNSRIPGLGKGVDEKWRLTPDQSEVAQALYQSHVGQFFTRTTGNVQVNFWEMDGEKHIFQTSLLLDLAGGPEGTPTC